MAMDFLKFDDLPKEAKQKLLDEGRKKLRWAEGHMPVLNQLGG